LYQKSKVQITDTRPGTETVTWCSSFKYLGMHFNAGKSLRVDVDDVET